MQAFDLILSDIYNSRDHANKGSAVCVSDRFFVARDQDLYLVLILEKSTFAGDFLGYDYSLYSVSKRAYINRDADAFAEMVSAFPLLMDIRQTGNMNFVEACRLTNLFCGLVDEIYECAGLNEDARNRYEAYLRDMSKMKSLSMQKLYAYFIKEIPNNVP